MKVKSTLIIMSMALAVLVLLAPTTRAEADCCWGEAIAAPFVAAGAVVVGAGAVVVGAAEVTAAAVTAPFTALSCGCGTCSACNFNLCNACSFNLCNPCGAAPVSYAPGNYGRY